jgi:hypothetical protein
VTETGDAAQTPKNALIPIPFQAPADQISYNAYIPECTKSCNVKLMMDIRETSISFNYFPFVAFAIQDEKQEYSVRVQVEYAPNKGEFEYSIVTRHKDTVVDKKLLSENSLPDIFQFSVQWTNDRFTVTPYIKEVGDGWFRHIASENALVTNLQFTPYSYAYLASGSQGRFILFSGEQNIISLNKPAVNVKPIKKNDL